MSTTYSVLVFSCSLWASHVGVIVKKQGKIELFTKPSKTAGKSNQVLFNGHYYTIKKVKLGTKILNGNILRTSKDSKVKIVYKNGDQFNIGEATSYEVRWTPNKGKQKDPSTINLLYGTLRGIVSKDGPRSGIKINTKSAVMGVRGTDFHVQQKGSSGKSSLTVLRGKVDLISKENPKRVIPVKQGFSAEIISQSNSLKAAKRSEENNKSEVLNLVATSKSNLIEINNASKIVESKDQVPKAIKAQIQSLEQKAIQTTLSDIKNYEPELFEKLKTKKIASVDTINNIVVNKAYEKAPDTPQKVNIDDIKLDEDIYDKYFKLEKF